AVDEIVPVVAIDPYRPAQGQPEIEPRVAVRGHGLVHAKCCVAGELGAVDREVAAAGEDGTAAHAIQGTRAADGPVVREETIGYVHSAKRGADTAPEEGLIVGERHAHDV